LTNPKPVFLIPKPFLPNSKTGFLPLLHRLFFRAQNRFFPKPKPVFFTNRKPGFYELKTGFLQTQNRVFTGFLPTQAQKIRFGGRRKLFLFTIVFSGKFSEKSTVHIYVICDQAFFFGRTVEGIKVSRSPKERTPDRRLTFTQISNLRVVDFKPMKGKFYSNFCLIFFALYYINLAFMFDL